MANYQPQEIIQESEDLKEFIARLNERLDEPFVTAGNVTGDKGINTCASRMQTGSLDLLRHRQVYPTDEDECERIMNNKIVMKCAQCHACMSIADESDLFKSPKI